MYKVTIPVMCHTAVAHKEKTLELLKRGGADRVAIAILRTPEYGFASNKGYGSAKHIEAIKTVGPCVIHRRSFIKNFL